jgi:hypothetical protein
VVERAFEDPPATVDVVLVERLEGLSDRSLERPDSLGARSLVRVLRPFVIALSSRAGVDDVEQLHRASDVIRRCVVEESGPLAAGGLMTPVRWRSLRF